MNRPLHIALVLFLGFALAGCAAKKPGMESLYAGLKEGRGALDTSVLSGKTIVIDPGHGGSINGTVGADSLREADANLGVALYLWGLCKDAGADAHLTRTTDRDLLPAGSTEAGADLKVRVEMANALKPDVFLSIHHNANPLQERDVNKIEVYYRAADPGASLELAEDVQVHLARNLGIEASEIRPGSYFVLRNSTARAAVLGEASYLSHPAVEERLKLSEKQRLEAEAYFLGLVQYFSRGVPRMTRVSPATDTIASPVEVRFAVRTDRGIPIDPASARVAVGSREQLAVFDPATSTVRLPLDPALPNGRYAIAGSARSALGGTARSLTDTILLARPARFLLPLPPQEKPGSTVALTVAVLDALGMRVADGTPATAVSLKDRSSRAAVCAGGTFTIEVPRALSGEAFAVSAPGITDTVRFARIAGESGAAILVCDASSLAGIPGAAVFAHGGGSVIADAHGRVLVPASGAPETLLVVAKGYRPLLVDTVTAGGPTSVVRAALEPLLGGVLMGRRIAVDPEGGGADPAGRGAGGLRGATVNLAVARHLRDLLERAGAIVTLTREGDEPISLQERIYAVNRAGAEFALGIAHRMPPAPAGSSRCALHYGGSERGRAFAERLAASIATLPPEAPCPTAESAALFLQQTACPAVEIYCGPVEDRSIEERAADDEWLRLEAEKLLAGLAASFGYDTGTPLTGTVRVVSGGAPAAGATIDLDGLAVRRTDAGGSASFDPPGPGAHLVTVRTAGGHTAFFMRNFPAAGGELVLDLP